MTEAVEVNAQGVGLETQTAVMGSVDATQSVVDLPLNGQLRPVGESHARVLLYSFRFARLTGECDTIAAI